MTNGPSILYAIFLIRKTIVSFNLISKQMEKEKNYITPIGLKRLQDELYELSQVERPEVTKTVTWAAGNGDRSENADYQYGKKRLREIDRRVRFLSKRIELSVVVDPERMTTQKIQFGATVKLEDENSGEEKIISIVGVDEIDVNKSHISWRSPLGSLLLGKEEGDSVTLKLPQGMKEYLIIEVEYKKLD